MAAATPRTRHADRALIHRLPAFSAPHPSSNCARLLYINPLCSYALHPSLSPHPSSKDLSDSTTYSIILSSWIPWHGEERPCRQTKVCMLPRTMCFLDPSSLWFILGILINALWCSGGIDGARYYWNWKWRCRHTCGCPRRRRAVHLPTSVRTRSLFFSTIVSCCVSIWFDWILSIGYAGDWIHIHIPERA
jgi:hypothetical protein